MDGGSFVLNMRTARCVASHTVPRRRTIPRTISAPMAPARSNGESSEVTYSVARTRTNIAPSVIATINTVVIIEARIVFMGRQQEDNSSRASRQSSVLRLEVPLSSSLLTTQHRRECPCHSCGGASGTQRKPDQSSATRIESAGLEGSYLMLAGWPGTKRSRRTWLSRPVMSCAVW